MCQYWCFTVLLTNLLAFFFFFFSLHHCYWEDCSEMLGVFKMQEIEYLAQHCEDCSRAGQLIMCYNIKHSYIHVPW